MTIRLEPLGAKVEAETGAPLRDLLLPFGVEFPWVHGGKAGTAVVTWLGTEASGVSDRLPSWKNDPAGAVKIVLEP